MSDYESSRMALERAREVSYRKVGDLSDEVLSRTLPMMWPTESGTEVFVWPGQTIGKIRIIRRPESLLLVTDGISDPWNTEITPEPPEFTFDLEFAVQVPTDQLEDTSDPGIAESWVPTFIWALTDWIVAERVDIADRILQYNTITLAVPPVRGLENLVASNGCIGVLTGIPFGGDSLGTQAVLATQENEVAVMMIGAKILTPDEYEWAMGVQDSSRNLELAEVFLKSGQRNLSWPNRKSILPVLAANSVLSSIQKPE